LSKGLSKLVQAGILILEKRGKKEFYYVNEKNEYSSLLLELWKKENNSVRNLSYEIKLVLAEFVRSLNDSCSQISKVILFGSQAKGTASVHSDLDLAVIFSIDLKQEMEVTRIVRKLERQFNVKIQVHYFTAESFSGKSKLIAEIKSDGIGLV